MKSCSISVEMLYDIIEIIEKCMYKDMHELENKSNRFELLKDKKVPDVYFKLVSLRDIIEDEYEYERR